MPNRILKETICTSDTINELSEAAEVFFYRLMVQCDDFGRADARPAILRANCYPLRLETMTAAEINRRLDELVRAGLVWLYEVNGRPYLQVTTWERHQQRRAKYSKYPAPPDHACMPEQEPADAGKDSDVPEDASICTHLQSDASNSPRGIEESRNRDTRNRGIESAQSSGASAPAPAPADPPAAPTEQREDEKPRTKRAPRSEAVKAFREVTGVWPNREQIAAIDRAVGAEKLDRWREAMRAWMLQGNKPTNVGGMLDWYRDGVPQRPGKPTNGGNSRASPAPPASTDWAAIARRTNHPQEVTDGGG